MTDDRSARRVSRRIPDTSPGPSAPTVDTRAEIDTPNVPIRDDVKPHARRTWHNRAHRLISGKTTVKVLIIEDDVGIATNLYDYLEGAGYEVDVAASGHAGLQFALAQPWDAILLDLSLPGMDGLTLCRKLREEAHRDTPVLMLTARDTLDNKLEGFMHGADDYLVKPFSLKEVGARLSALIKRYRGQVAQAALCCADVRFDLQTLAVERGGRPIKMPPKCLQLLRILMQSPNRVFGRAELETEVWGEHLPGSDTLRTHVYTLRRALTAPGEKDLIETVHGLGYRFVVSDADAS